jgi:hypothetical protein
MKKVLAMMMSTLLLAVTAQAEFRHVQMTVFGMD